MGSYRICGHLMSSVANALVFSTKLSVELSSVAVSNCILSSSWSTLIGIKVLYTSFQQFGRTFITTNLYHSCSSLVIISFK